MPAEVDWSRDDPNLFTRGTERVSLPLSDILGAIVVGDNKGPRNADALWPEDLDDWQQPR